MTQLPDEIKLTYIVAIIVVMLFVGFIILVVFVYNRRQLIVQQQNQLKEVEHQNQLLQKELERQKAIEEERLRIAHDMHDDLGAGISAIKLQAEFLKKKLNGAADTDNDINDLLKTSQEMNISMREMLWSLDTHNDTIEQLISYTTSYAENYLSKTTIKLSASFYIQNPQTTLPAALRRNIFLCIKEALNNICKYSNATTATLLFYQKQDNLIVDIKDNGIGLGKNPRFGSGLKNMKSRMESFGGSFEITPSTPGLHLHFSIPAATA